MECFWVYILRCSDGSYYVGHTDSIEKRTNEHQFKSYSCYTTQRLPVVLVFYHPVASRAEALELERKIKGWSRKKKESLIKGNWQRISMLAKKKFD